MAFKISTGTKRGKASSMVWIAVLVFFMLLAAGVVGYSFLFSAKANDSRTLCPAGGPLGHVVLLVDKSDPLTFTQRKSFDVLYEEVVTRIVPKGHLLSVYALADDFSATAEPLLERCNPGDGSDLDPLYKNPVRQKKAFDEKYVKPMHDIRGDLVTEKSGKASPILEMIQLVGITGFRRHAIPGEKRLIIVSDMIQNTPQLNMYKTGVPSYQSFAETAYGKKTLADLKGVKVEFRILLNTPRLQREELLNFWEREINQSGGKLELSEPVKG
jgi:hypothetical protein